MMLSRIRSESVDSPERRIASMVWRIASTTSVRGWRSKRSLTSDLSSSPLTLGKFRRGSALICVSVATPAVGGLEVVEAGGAGGGAAGGGVGAARQVGH